MNLTTGKQIIRNHWTDLRISTSIIQHVHYLTAKKPERLLIIDALSNPIPDSNDEDEDDHEPNLLDVDTTDLVIRDEHNVVANADTT